ncbi:dTMP kinase [Sporomusa aerivorans]|uniref:dTMP kinase n=1 Tax=Sporomusa aerivorans TaxID=204936 RepID=UPI00352ACDA1
MGNNIKNSYAGIYVFEGIDNVGKTTIIQALQEKICKEIGYDCTTIAFPGNEARTLGALVYDVHHHENKYFDFPINNASLQLLHVAAHIDLIQRKLIEEYSSSKIILMDRFWWSTYAYGLAGRLERDVVHAILAPELVYWEKININKIFLLERKDRKIDYETNKDILIRKNYSDLAKRESKCQIINNDGRLEETTNRVLINILGV